MVVSVGVNVPSVGDVDGDRVGRSVGAPVSVVGAKVTPGTVGESDGVCDGDCVVSVG